MQDICSHTANIPCYSIPASRLSGSEMFLDIRKNHLQTTQHLLSIPSSAETFFRHASVSRTYPCLLVGPQKLFFTEISVSVAQIKKNSKNLVHLFSNFDSGRTLPTSQLVRNPFQSVFL